MCISLVGAEFLVHSMIFTNSSETGNKRNKLIMVSVRFRIAASAEKFQNHLLVLITQFVVKVNFNPLPLESNPEEN